MRKLWSAEAEQSVIGSLMLDEQVFDDVVAVGFAADMFFDRRHVLAFLAIASLIDERAPSDVVTVAERLEQRGELDLAGGAGYLSRMIDLTPSVDNVTAYACLVRDFSVERGYHKAARDMLALLEDESFPDHSSRVAALQQILTATEREERALTMQPLGGALKAMVDDVEVAFEGGGFTGLATGWQHVDYRLGGLQPGDFMVIAARPGMGKTAYILNILRHVAIEQKLNAVMFSLEMPNKQLAARMTSATGSVNLGLIKSGKVLGLDEQASKFGMAVTSLAGVSDRIWLDDEGSLPISELVARAKRLHRKTPLSLVVVDHIGLVESTLKTENEPQRIAQVSRALKKLAKELSCPVIGLCQVNRECEKRSNKRPQMSDLRMSGAIEQDADVIQFLYRDEYYNEDTQTPGQVEVISGKVRNGERGVDYLAWRGAYQRMDSMERPADSGSDHAGGDFV
jgi:replicative DNA helicase